MNAEVVRATAANVTLTTNLNAEVSRAKGAESTEVSRATAAEVTLTTNLNAEVVRAKGAESTITTNLNAEVVRATNTETSLSNFICLGSVGFGSCFALKVAGCITTAKLYTITPRGSTVPMQVWCDIDGWTLVVGWSFSLFFFP